MSDTYGRTSPRQFAFYDPDGSCWRMWPAISLWGSEPYSETWPQRGSMRNGACFEHPTWVPATSVPDCSSLLGTPTARDYKDGASIGSWPENSQLGRQVWRFLPTPRTSDTNGAGLHGDGGPDLRTAVTLLPTPVVNDMGEGKTVEGWDQWTDTMRAKHRNGNGHGRSLAIEAARLLPTPCRADTGSGQNPEARAARGHGAYLEAIRFLLPTPNASDFKGATTPEAAKDWEFRGVNLPERIQRLRGETTAPPSSDGDTFSDDPPRLPLMTEDG